jgi:hypothetical protein
MVVLSKKFILGSLSAVFAVLGLSNIVLANTQASANGTAVAEVVGNISITAGNDLNFGLGNAGDGAKTLAPNDPDAGDFLVQGEANYAYTITLPADGVVVLKKGAGSTTETRINVNSFTSSPSVSGNLGAGGQQTLQVGATRDALLANQESGFYTTTYVVTVAY